ncbi:MAG: biosynthetic-type acetolactate synthase large subunit, partial [Candidatus Omnitrophica bacterium]|nr:biosynthetic-type acetolactate synthase large subunit [Candidatus Omnitrophota bacterium]
YGHPGQIRRALKTIYEAKRPVIMAGGGVILSGASKELRDFAEKMRIPVISTFMGLGVFPTKNELSLGMPGMHGSAYANLAITECDLLISVGCRFDDRVTGKLDEFAPKAKIIHIDIDPTSISKNVNVDVPVVGDAKNILAQLIQEIKEEKITEKKEWIEKINEWKKQYPLKYERKEKKWIKPQYVIEEVCRMADEDAIIATEVGQHQMWVAQFYSFEEPRRFLSSGGLGTMGYGFPASIGAKIACPEKQVILFAGDGSIQMNIQEMATLKTYGINVKIIILNNNSLGMVRQWQELFFDKRYSGTPLNNPDFVTIAKGYGIKGIRVEKTGDVKSAIEKILKFKGPILAEFLIEPEENVFPMVPAGKAINQMIGGMS